MAQTSIHKNKMLSLLYLAPVCPHKNDTPLTKKTKITKGNSPLEKAHSVQKHVQSILLGAKSPGKTIASTLPPVSERIKKTNQDRTVDGID